MSENAIRKPIDRLVPWLFVLFFAVVIAANGTLVYFAAASWTGVETRQPYIKGLDYNRTLEQVERQKALGWDGTLLVRPEDRNIRIELTLTDSSRRAVGGARVTVGFVRPTHEGYDFEITLEDRGGGRYAGIANVPLPGQWDVRAAAEHPSGAYRVTRRVMVP